MTEQPLVLAHATSLHMPLRDKSIHTVCTSPPYYGLRSYQGVEPSCFPGGSYAPVPGAAPVVIPGPTPEALAACVHEWGTPALARDHGSRHGKGPGSTLTGGRHVYDALPDHAHEQSTTCRRCGCWRGTYGNEERVERYVWHTLLWLREVKRVLRDDGTVWLNIGDSYSSGDRQGHGTRIGYKQQTNRGMNGTADPPRAPQPDGYAPGCLLGIPQQILLAAVADGWVVRNDLVWSKSSPMPESVRGWAWQPARCRCVQPHRDLDNGQTYTFARPGATNTRRQHRGGDNGMVLTPATTPDPACPQCGGSGVLAKEVLRKGSWRHTRSHETVLMLTKGMQYWANGEAVREELSCVSRQQIAYFLQHGENTTRGPKLLGHIRRNSHGRLDATGRGARGAATNPAGRNPRSVLRDAPSATGELAALHQWLGQHCPEILEAYQADQQNPCDVVTPRGASLDLPHYASYPPDLLVPLIKATCPERCCPVCGQGWAPSIAIIAERETRPGLPIKNDGSRKDSDYRNRRIERERRTTGLRPTCTHYCTCANPPELGALCSCGKRPLSAFQPGIVLDCFAGSGTTLLVSRALGRRAVGIDASWYYVAALARQRLGLTALAAWHHGAAAREECFTDLPLFGLA